MYRLTHICVIKSAKEKQKMLEEEKKMTEEEEKKRQEEEKAKYYKENQLKQGDLVITVYLSKRFSRVCDTVLVIIKLTKFPVPLRFE